MKNIFTLTSVSLLLLSSMAFAETKTLEVESRAYNSVASQTTSNKPALTAWGDTLKPGMKAIAVSRDLIKMGLTHNTKVKIKGLDGHYLVLDKMNKRWTKKIDIYMGVDTKAAKAWGKQKVTISWTVAKDKK
ncbi:MAG: 3D domain-containing protein [Gammaproteobacteria bacterium]|nr:3D domain-containing protein [Gammaproteobacteria bacterium]